MMVRAMHPLVSDPDGFDYTMDQNTMNQGTKTEGRVSWKADGKTVYLQVSLEKNLSGTEQLGALQYLSEHVTRRFHAEKLILQRHENMNWKLLNSCGYYAKGACFQKKTDPWRLSLSDRIFDAQGYIIYQGRMDKVPFGWFNTREKGCGWIAAWNLLRMNGMEVRMQKVMADLEKHAFLGEAAGVNLLTLLACLRKQGLDVSLSFPSDRLAVKAVQNSSSGILMYNHRQGAHYTAFRTLQGETVHFYNAVYGKSSHEEALSAFLKRNDLIPVSMVISVSKTSMEKRLNGMVH